MEPTNDDAHEVGLTTRSMEVQASGEFEELRRTFRRWVFPMTGLFLAWYFLYVLMSNYAHDFMSRSVVGNVHVGLVFGLLQFVSTFLIAWYYARYSSRELDPIADSIRNKMEEGAE